MQTNPSTSQIMMDQRFRFHFSPPLMKVKSPVLLKYLYLLGLLLLLFLVLTFTQSDIVTRTSNLFRPFDVRCREELASTSIIETRDSAHSPPTNLSHIVFVLVGSLGGWRIRRPYVEAWWRPNVTRGNLFLDVKPTQEFLPWPETSPPFQVNEDVKKFKIYSKLSNAIHLRLYRSILETYRLTKDGGVRWFVMGDEDTLFFVDNIAELLAKHDHTEYRYIGMHSETIVSNIYFSFDMAYGGGGYALSYPLVETLVTKLEECIERYYSMWAADQLQSACLADLGVDLIKEKGFHQMDLRGDASGFLSSHPSSPLLSLHHFKTLDPLFPGMNKTGSVSHLMKAANVDQTRILQQSICHHRPKNWTFSLSWGYSAHIYEKTLARSQLRKPIQTFRQWLKGPPPNFMFNIRRNSRDPCETPHWFFFDSIHGNGNSRDGVVTYYARSLPRNLPACSSSGNHSAESITRIQVISPRTRKQAGRVECCNVKYNDGDFVTIRLRNCGKGEVIA